MKQITSFWQKTCILIEGRDEFFVYVNVFALSYCWTVLVSQNLMRIGISPEFCLIATKGYLHRTCLIIKLRRFHPGLLNTTKVTHWCHKSWLLSTFGGKHSLIFRSMKITVINHKNNKFHQLWQCYTTVLALKINFKNFIIYHLLLHGIMIFSLF